MLKFVAKSLKYTFAIIPERSNRFFNLSIQTNLQSPISQILQQQHQKYIKASQDRGEILLAYEMMTQVKQNSKFYYLFQSPNQVEAHDFAKGSPFKGHIKNICIEEVEMKRRVKQKELVPRHLRE